MKTVKQLLTISLFIILTSCSKDSDATVAPTATNASSPTDIYIVGMTKNSNNNKIPTLWKNGVPNILPSDLNTPTFANKVAVSGSDIYVVNENDFTRSILLWKNGIIVQTIPNSRTHEIIVVGNDVYILGQTENTFKTWKNGVETILTSNVNNNFVFKMKVVNGDVYAAGSERVGTKNIAKFWKNGAATAISDTSFNSFVDDFEVVNNEVTVLFREQNTATTENLKVWKNGNTVTLESGLLSNGTIGRGFLEVVGNIQYALTRQDLGLGNRKIILFKNGIKSDITTGTLSNFPIDMKIVGNDVHVLAIERNIANAANTSILNHFKNTQKTILINGELTGSVSDASMTDSNNGDVHIAVSNKYFKNNSSSILPGSLVETRGIFVVN